ncbi:MAG: hypothetical protein IIY88_03610 [Eubacterium sp.]|nr:hypothetical protein [Eubacterium sp.]
MNQTCSICGNIYKNIAFRGGFICADCREFIRELDCGPAFRLDAFAVAEERTAVYRPNSITSNRLETDKPVEPD